MRHAPLVVLLLLPAAAAAKTGSVSMKQIGAGGGYTHPSAEAGDYLENGPRSEIPPAPTLPPAAPRLPAALPPAPPLPPAAREPAAAVKAPAAALVTAPKEKEPAAAPRAPTPSLWNGLVKPLAAAAASGDEAASATGAREYDGASEAPALAADAPLDAPRDAVSDSGSRPRDALFVSVELDPGEASTLRDAVAGLGGAGFTQDHRFETRMGAGGASIITGWLPSSRLAEAVTRPGVRRVSIETSARPSRPTETDGAFLIGLRVPDSSRPRESIEPALQALSREAGLRAHRVLGLETAPDGRVVAVVSGRLPLSRLAKAMGRADVVKLVPAPPPGVPVLPAPALPAPPTPGGFAKFMAKKGLWLVVLTVLVGLLPPARAGIGRGLKALVPYH